MWDGSEVFLYDPALAKPQRPNPSICLLKLNPNVL